MGVEECMQNHPPYSGPLSTKVSSMSPMSSMSSMHKRFKKGSRDTMDPSTIYMFQS